MELTTLCMDIDGLIVVIPAKDRQLVGRGGNLFLIEYLDLKGKPLREVAKALEQPPLNYE